MISQHLAVLGVALVFIVVGMTNRARGKGPWRALLCGGVALAVMDLLNCLGWVKM